MSISIINQTEELFEEVGLLYVAFAHDLNDGLNLLRGTENAIPDLLAKYHPVERSTQLPNEPCRIVFNSIRRVGTTEPDVWAWLYRDRLEVLQSRLTKFRREAIEASPARMRVYWDRLETVLSRIQGFAAPPITWAMLRQRRVLEIELKHIRSFLCRYPKTLHLGPGEVLAAFLNQVFHDLHGYAPDAIRAVQMYKAEMKDYDIKQSKARPLERLPSKQTIQIYKWLCDEDPTTFEVKGRTNNDALFKARAELIARELHLSINAGTMENNWDQLNKHPPSDDDRRKAREWLKVNGYSSLATRLEVISRGRK